MSLAIPHVKPPGNSQTHLSSFSTARTRLACSCHLPPCCSCHRCTRSAHSARQARSCSVAAERRPHPDGWRGCRDSSASQRCGLACRGSMHSAESLWLRRGGRLPPSCCCRSAAAAEARWGAEPQWCPKPCPLAGSAGSGWCSCTAGKLGGRGRMPLSPTAQLPELQRLLVVLLLGSACMLVVRRRWGCGTAAAAQGRWRSRPSGLPSSVCTAGKDGYCKHSLQPVCELDGIPPCQSNARQHAAPLHHVRAPIPNTGVTNLPAGRPPRRSPSGWAARWPARLSAGRLGGRTGTGGAP